MNPKVCTLFGVPLHFHISFIMVMLIWCVLMPNMIIPLFLLFASVVAHEYGHVLAARYCGIGCKWVVLTPLGGIAYLEGMPRDSNKELIITWAGPLVSLVLALWGGALAVITYSFTDFFVILAGGNLMLFIFNILPVFPMDGGRILRASLHYWLPYEKATLIAVRIGQGMAGVLIVISILSFNFMLCLLMVIIAWASQQELNNVRGDVH
jgi:Zn-dependent protease